MYTIYILRILRTTSCNLLCDFIYHFSLHSLIGSIIAYATSTNSLSSTLSSYDTYLIRSIILTSSSSPLSLKISIISRLSIKGAVPSSLFASICAKWFIIPKHPLLLQAQHYTKTIAFILSSSEVILLYFYCAKEGLVYIVIAALFSC